MHSKKQFCKIAKTVKKRARRKAKVTCPPKRRARSSRAGLDFIALNCAFSKRYLG